MLVLRRRRVRLHQQGEGPTIEGLLVGSLDNHYRLLRPVVWETADRSHSLSDEVWVPRERVLFVETIRS
jgi:hypothetical protein